MIPYILMGSAVACAGAFWYGTGVGEDRLLAKQSKEDKIVMNIKDEAMRGAAEAIAKLKPRNTTIVNEVQREIQNNTVYTDCRNTSASMLGINEALTGKRPEPAGDKQLPRAVTVK